MFTAEDLRWLLNRKPFVPFKLKLSDGEIIEIKSRELVMAGRRSAVVGILDPDAKDTLIDSWTVVWYMHVTSIEDINPGAPPFTEVPPASEKPTPV